MTNKIRNDFAAYGLDILKRSVLLVLYEAKQTPRGPRKLQPDKIRQLLDLPRVSLYGERERLVHGVLKHLDDDGLVDHTVDIGWEITTDGIEFIEG